MPEVRYGGKNGQAVQLETDPSLVAVRTISRRSFRDSPVPRPELEVLDDLELVEKFPEAGVEVYRQRERTTRSVEDVKRTLRAFPDTKFAGSVLVDSKTGEPVLYTENIFVKFRDEEDPAHCRNVLQEAGLAVKKELEYATNAFFAEAAEGTGQKIFDIANALLAREDVEYAHPELVQKAVRRQIFSQQWHLMTTSVNNRQINASANVEAAHRLTLGEGTTIAVIDDGFDLGHPEFSSAGKIVAPFDFRSNDSDPAPGDDDNHGTACAGVACADGRLGASGVAPKARLMPIRMPLSLGSQRLASAFQWAADNGADVISCSWGPLDGPWWNLNHPAHQGVALLPDNIRLAIDYAVNNGRAGRGCVILFAAGNGNESVDNDGYASYAKVLAVAASNDRGKRSVYSDFGSAVFCSFPSSDFGWPAQNRPEPLTPGIWTTDRLGRAGYNPDPDSGAIAGDSEGSYTSTFGGTSSACPGAAGVAALVIARNPELTWLEVKDIMRRGCDRIDPQGGQYDGNGHSRSYGYGRLNAEAAVLLARPAVPETDNLVVRRTFAEPVMDFQTARVGLDVTETARLSDVRVIVDIEHTFIGDLVVTLIPPAATGLPPVPLHRRTGGRTRNIGRTYSASDIPALASLAGQSAQGRWELEVRDEALEDIGRINVFGLELKLALERAVPAAGGVK